ncbi:MAG: PAS domain-containing protein [Bacteroidota bacterium]
MKANIEVKNAKGTIYMLNKAAASQYNKQTREVIGKSVFDFFDRVTAQKYFDIEKEIIEKKKTVRSLEKVKHGNKTLYLEIQKACIFLPEFDDWGLLVIQDPIETSRAISEDYHMELKQRFPGITIDIY